MAKARFGVGGRGGLPGSRYWSIKTSSSRAEFYVRGSRTGAFYGISIHEDRRHWHWKVRPPGEHARYMTFDAPDPMPSGIVRAHTIISHAAIGDRGPRAETSKPVYWHEPSSENVQVRFTVFVDTHPVETEDWPGGSTQGTQLVSRLPLADGSSVVVVVHELPHEDQSFQLPVEDPERAFEATRAAIERGADSIVLMGRLDDGSGYAMEGWIGIPSEGAD